MSTSVQRLQRTIDTEKAAISRNLGALEDKARALVDWREPVRARPWEAVTLALLGGGAIALLSGRRSRKTPRAAATGGPEPTVAPEARSHDVRRRLAQALTTVALAKVADVLRSNAPAKGDTPG